MIPAFSVGVANLFFMKGTATKNMRNKRKLQRIRSKPKSKNNKNKIKFPRRSPKNNSVRRFASSEKKNARGIFRGNRHGYGFVSCEELGDDIFIPAKRKGGAIDGDTVRVSYTENEGRYEGGVTEILKYSDEPFIGTVYTDDGSVRERRRGGQKKYVVMTDDGKIPDGISVTLPQGVKPGDKVEVKLDRNPGGLLKGEIIRSFGRADSREANYGAILAENGIETEFDDETLDCAYKMARRPLSRDGRTILTEETIFTIDGAGAKDLDDAISLTVLDSGKYLLGVHIADVSEYVLPHTPLDRTAMRRGTSVYFTDKVVPMLPPALSNGACSLNAGEEKYALSAFITISKDGTIERTKIVRSVIVSRVRGVYSEVNDIFAKGQKSEFYEKYSAVYKTLGKMYKLYKILAAKSAKRGSLELERSEAEILLDGNGMPTDIIARERGDAEKLIEQFMLAANEGVATLLHDREYPCVYRVHDRPTPEKLHDFCVFAHNSGFDTSAFYNENYTGAAFGDILEKAKEKGNSSAISYIILRTMAKAKYSEQNSIHFGLGIRYYCHFTSPIRRLSDLATHRMIKAVLLDGEKAEKYRGYARRAAAATSETELSAMSAERSIDDLYKCIYMQNFIGKEFDASITMITSFGIFAELDNTCEGLILLSDLDERSIYDEKSISVFAGGKKYSLADRIRIKVESTDISSRRVRFSIVTDSKDDV